MVTPMRIYKVWVVFEARRAMSYALFNAFQYE